MSSAQDYAEHHSYDNDHLLSDAQVAQMRAAAAEAEKALQTCRYFKLAEGHHVRLQRPQGAVEYQYVVSVNVPLGQVELRSSITQRRGGQASTLYEGIQQVNQYLSGVTLEILDGEQGHAG